MQDWSLPSSDGWSLLHDAALLYLTCMHGPDEEIDSSESAVVKELIRARGAGDAGVDRVYDEAMLMYVGTSGGEMIAASIASLGQSLTEKQRKELLLELARVATSDGIVYPSEARLLGEIATTWGLAGVLGDPRQNSN